MNKQKLIKAIESIQPGVSKTNTVELSEFVHFNDNEILSYNDIICVSSIFESGINGAVKGDELLNILKKLNEEDLVIKVDKNKLIITQKKKKKEIKVSMTLLKSEFKTWPEPPKKWNKLPSNFIEGIKATMFSAAIDLAYGVLASIYIEKNSILACDNHRIAVFQMDKEIKEPILIPITAVKQLINYNIIEYAQDENWLYFANNDDTIFSCRKIDGDYPTGVWELLKIKGIEFTFPKDFKETLERSQIFQEESNQIEFHVNANEIICKASSKTGSIKEKSVINYVGDPFHFLVNSDLIKQIIDTTGTAIIGENSLLFEIENLKYVVALISNE